MYWMVSLVIICMWQTGSVSVLAFLSLPTLFWGSLGKDSFVLPTIMPCSGCHLSYCMIRVTNNASSRPYSLSTTWRAPSIPAEIPAVVSSLPSSTNRVSRTTLVWRSNRDKESITAAWLVIVFPLVKPALLIMKAPVQTDILTCVCWWTLLIQAKTAGFLYVATLPPGQVALPEQPKCRAAEHWWSYNQVWNAGCGFS